MILIHFKCHHRNKNSKTLTQRLQRSFKNNYRHFFFNGRKMECRFFVINKIEIKICFEICFTLNWLSSATVRPSKMPVIFSKWRTNRGIFLLITSVLLYRWSQWCSCTSAERFSTGSMFHTGTREMRSAHHTLQGFPSKTVEMKTAPSVCTLSIEFNYLSHSTQVAGGTVFRKPMV